MARAPGLRSEAMKRLMRQERGMHEYLDSRKHGVIADNTKLGKVSETYQQIESHARGRRKLAERGIDPSGLIGRDTRVGQGDYSE